MKFTVKPKSIPFSLEDSDGNSVNLVFTGYTIGDVTRLMELQKPLIESDDNDVLKFNKLSLTRLMCSVKHAESGDYYWSGSIDEFIDNDYPKEMIEEMLIQVNALNPIKVGDDLDSKKNNS